MNYYFSYFIGKEAKGIRTSTDKITTIGELTLQKENSMAKFTCVYNKDTCTWIGVASINDKVIATTEAWSKVGVVLQLTNMIGRRL